VIPLAQGDQMTDHAAKLEWSSLAALRERNFWAITATVALNFCGSGAVLTHLVPFATDVGFSPLEASFALSATAAMGVTGKLLFGFVSDRVDRRLAFGLASALQATGVALLLFAQSYPSLLVAGGVFGLGMGGIVPLWGAVVGAGFGRLAFGRVMGLMSPFMVPVQTLGVPLAGYIFDRTGRYDMAFYTFLGTYAASIAAISLLRLPHSEPGAVLVRRPASEHG
jgi:predicted MFS family arabinose efflux permease